MFIHLGLWRQHLSVYISRSGFCCHIGQWYSHWLSSAVWNGRHSMFIIVFMCGCGGVSKSSGAVHCSNRQSCLFLCAHEKVLSQDADFSADDHRFPKFPRCVTTLICLYRIDLIICACFTMETGIYLYMFFILLSEIEQQPHAVYGNSMSHQAALLHFCKQSI